MGFFLTACGVVLCVALFLKGYFLPLLIGGFVGSFLGIAGFGGAISGAIPGAIIGAVIAIAMKKG